jgi:hypothetical protein
MLEAALGNAAPQELNSRYPTAKVPCSAGAKNNKIIKPHARSRAFLSELNPVMVKKEGKASQEA